MRLFTEYADAARRAYRKHSAPECPQPVCVACGEFWPCEPAYRAFMALVSFSLASGAPFEL